MASCLTHNHRLGRVGWEWWMELSWKACAGGEAEGWEGGVTPVNPYPVQETLHSFSQRKREIRDGEQSSEVI